MPLNIRKVENDDLEQLVKLINVAYRTQSGRSWTTEQAFVAGDRINKTQLIDQLNQSNFEFILNLKLLKCKPNPTQFKTIYL